MSIEPILLSGVKNIVKNIDSVDILELIFKVGYLSGLTKVCIDEVAGSILSVEGFQILEQQSTVFIVLRWMKTKEEKIFHLFG